jgi:hypothetical protein
VSRAVEPGGGSRRRVRIAAGAVTAVMAVAALMIWCGRHGPSGGRYEAGGDRQGPPPAGGALPFDGVERAAYRLTWRVAAGGGMTAGRATLGAQLENGVRHFTLDVETAAWLAGLYNVRGRIESWAGTGTLPSRQEQHLREGLRPTDRTTRFDQAARTFTLGDGPPVSSPPDSRDGLSAWFHVRTLPLAAAYSVRFPVVEAGRIYDVGARVARRSHVSVGGRDVEAFQLDLRVDSVAERREIARAALWISADRRRVPLVLDVETSLGPVRAELDAYERR